MKEGNGKKGMIMNTPEIKDSTDASVSYLKRVAEKIGLAPFVFHFRPRTRRMISL